MSHLCQAALGPASRCYRLLAVGAAVAAAGIPPAASDTLVVVVRIPVAAAAEFAAAVVVRAPFVFAIAAAG